MRLSPKKVEKRGTTAIISISLLLVIALGYNAISGEDVVAAGNHSGELVAEYRFDEGAGKTAYDTSNNSYDGILTDFSFDGSDGWASGLSGKAIEFSSGDYIDIDSFNLKDKEELTVSLWINPDSVSSNTPGHGGAGGQDNELVWFSHDGDAFTLNLGNNDEMYGYVDPGSNGGSGSEGGCSVTTSSNVISTSEWQMVTGVYDGDSLHIYHNSEEVGSCSAGTEAFESSSGAQISSHRDSSFSDWFDGTVDAVKIYDKGLNQSQVNSLYNLGSYTTGEENQSGGKVLDIGFRKQNSTHVFDTSGENNHGKPRNGASQIGAVECKVGRCYEFDGGDDYIDVPHDPSLNISTFTVMAWARLTSGADLNRKHEVVSKGDYTMKIRYDDRNSGWRTGIYGEDGNWYQALNSEKPQRGEWIHLASTFNSSGALKLYIDGNLTNTTLTGTNPSSSISDNSSFEIGRHANNAGNWFDGLIDQVKVFNRSLSQKEIVRVADKLEASGAVLDFRLDEEGGDIAKDSSLHGNHGALNPNESNGPSWTRGVSGNALEFDGNNDYLEANQNILDAVSNSSFTISSWIYRKSTADDTFIGLISSGFDGFILVRNDGAYENAKLENVEGDRLGLNSPDIPQEKWTHVVLSYDHANGEAKVYYNADLEASGSFTASQSKNIDVTSENPSIGRDGRGIDYFQGKMDEIKVYPYELSYSKVKQLYNQGSSSVGRETTDLTPPQYPSDDNLKLYQSFDRVENCGQSDTLSCPPGMSGEIAIDESGDANHGELVNGLIEKESQNCKVGKCLGFDGSGDFIEVSDDSNFDWGDELSASGWVKLDEWSSDGALVGKNSGGSSEPLLWADSGNQNFAWGVNTDNGFCKIDSTGETRKSGEWYHVAGTYNGSSIGLYVDGVLVSESFGSCGGSITRSSSDVFLGQAQGGGKRLNGILDDLKIYDNSLSKDEIWSLYTQGRDRQGRNEIPGSLAWWRFSGSGQTVYDFSGDQDGTLGGDATSETTDPSRVNTSRGEVLEFDGSDDLVNISDSDKFDSDNLTVSAWIKATDKNQDLGIVSKDNGNAGFSRDWTALYIDESSGDSIVARDGSSTAVKSNQPPNFGSWEHWTVVFDSDSREVRLYRNGEETASSSYDGALQDGNSPITIGQYYSSGRNMNGMIDDVRIYPYALSHKQVKMVMNSGAAAIQ